MTPWDNNIPTQTTGAVVETWERMLMRRLAPASKHRLIFHGKVIKRMSIGRIHYGPAFEYDERDRRSPGKKKDKDDIITD